MTESQSTPSFDFEEKVTAFDQKIEAMSKIATVIMDGYSKLANLTLESALGLKEIREKLLPLLQLMKEEQDKLRGMLLSKMDGLQGTMDLVREDTRNAWGTADFAISNSRHIREINSHMREDTDKILNMMSVMQKQQQLLTSQVEELRKKDAEKEQGL